MISRSVHSISCAKLLGILWLLGALLVTEEVHACEFTGDNGGMPTFDTCPKTLTNSLQKAVQCHALGGQIIGDNGPADQKLTRKMKTLRCGRSDSEIAEVSRIYSKNPELTSVITAVEQKYGLDKAE